MSLLLVICGGVAAAGLGAATVHGSVVDAARARWHRVLTLLAGLLGTGAVGLLVAGARTAGVLAAGLAVEAFLGAVVLVGIRRGPDDGEDGGGGGGGPGGPPPPPDDPDLDPVDPVDWDRFHADLEAHVQRQSSSRS